MHPHQKLSKDLYRSTKALMQYCKRSDWAGFDPYDALNSRMYRVTPLIRSRICNICITQVLRRVPINLRPFLLIPRKQNPKALALFISSQLKLLKLGLVDSQAVATHLTERLRVLRAPENEYFCWGYSFPWQTRGVLVPSGAANLVCTTFVANALMDVYESLHDTESLQMAVSATDYVLNELYWEEGDAAGFSYPLPHLRFKVPNANFLAAALLCRAHRLSGKQAFLQPALKAARHSVTLQHEDGAWHYGELPTQRWIDNFHTGYNLCSLRSIGINANTEEFEAALQRGFSFYKKHFFREDGAPKYFHDKTYPLDIHCVAQSIITLVLLADLDGESRMMARSVAEWAMRNMWDEEGFFYYQIHRLYRNKISYMRWSQAWMLFALCTLLEQEMSTSVDDSTPPALHDVKQALKKPDDVVA